MEKLFLPIHFFDKIYCINLDRRPEKWLQCEQEFNKHGLTVERFSAVDGNPDKIVSKLTDGAIGCIKSHLNIIKLAKELNLKNVLIFEDDVEFIDDLNNIFQEYYKQIPTDWGLLYFGVNHNNLPLLKFTENLSFVKHTYTTHAYAVNNRLYDMIIETLSNFENECDILLTKIQELGNSYVFQPHLAWQRAGYSDILNVEANYDFLKTGYTL